MWIQKTMNNKNTRLDALLLLLLVLLVPFAFDSIIPTPPLYQRFYYYSNIDIIFAIVTVAIFFCYQFNHSCRKYCTYRCGWIHPGLVWGFCEWAHILWVTQVWVRSGIIRTNIETESTNRANLMVTVDKGNVIVQAESVKPLHLKIEDQSNQIKVV